MAFYEKILKKRIANVSVVRFRRVLILCSLKKMLSDVQINEARGCVNENRAHAILDQVTFICTAYQ